MAKKRKTIKSSSKRFGARYGRTIRSKIAKVENVARNSTKCPYCNKDGLKRVSAGIYNCSKCNAKFTGQAYVPKPRFNINQI
jgi:large subunit ribosomal protein L37Ae